MNRFLLAFLCLLTFRTSTVSADTFAYVPRPDGTITRFRADSRTGKLLAVAPATDTGTARRVELVASADRRFLFAFRAFDSEKDGYTTQSGDGYEEQIASEHKPTLIMVFAVSPDGALRRIQTLSVPYPVAQLLPHPGGKWVYILTPTGATVLTVDANHRLAPKRRIAFSSGFDTQFSVGLRAETEIAFAPGGGYLYHFVGTGFVDHSENNLITYRVNDKTGTIRAEGEAWYGGSGRESPAESVREDPGRVLEISHKSAFVEGYNGGIWVCRVNDAGRIAAHGSQLSLKSSYGVGTLAFHPALPLLYFRGSSAEPFHVWRITAPGNVRRVATFASAFGKENTGLQMSPDGRFLYEIAYTFSDKTGMITAYRVAVHRVSKTGKSVQISAPPKLFPDLWGMLLLGAP